MSTPLDHAHAFLAGGGTMGARMRAHDWAATPLGHPDTWPEALRTMVSVVLNSKLLGTLLWGPELRLLYNDAYAPALAERHPDALGRPIAEVWGGVVWDNLAPGFLRVMETGEPIFETRYPLPIVRYGREELSYWNYSVAPVRDGRGQIVGLLNQALEITGEMRAEAQLAAAEAQLLAQNQGLVQEVTKRTAELKLYHDIVQSDPSPILAFDTDHRLIGFNQAHYDDFVRVMGIAQQIGDHLPDQFPPEQATALRSLMDRALAGETFSVVAQFGDDDRAKPTWDISYTPLRDEGGRIIGAFHHARDISARIHAEQELQELQEHLRQSQKMEAVGQLTGGVAHDFNNLLTIIRSSVDFLRRPDLPDERRTRYLDAVSDTVGRAAKLTGQLLAFARRQALKPEVFDVGAKLQSIGDMLDTVTGARIRVVIEIPEQPCFIRADANQFEIALVNMAVNARDAMDGEGQLTLRLDCNQTLPQIRGHAPSRSVFVAVSVSDTGSGIPEDQLARVFEPFFTTKEVGKGTGLGLSQVFGFVKQSGGDVDVTSVVAKGTTFTLYLPEEEVVPAPMAEEASGRSLAPVGAGQRVLVVEDNIEVGRFCTQSLQDLGYRTEWAANAEEALLKLGADGNGFDAVFSDVVMPGMGGVALAEALRARLPNLPVVLASGYSHVLAQDTAHGFELLHKPYSAEQLTHVLQRVMAKNTPPSIALPAAE